MQISGFACLPLPGRKDQAFPTTDFLLEDPGISRSSQTAGPLGDRSSFRSTSSFFWVFNFSCRAVASLIYQTINAVLVKKKKRLFKRGDTAMARTLSLIDEYYCLGVCLAGFLFGTIYLSVLQLQRPSLKQSPPVFRTLFWYIRPLFTMPCKNSQSELYSFLCPLFSIYVIYRHHCFWYSKFCDYHASK